LFEEGMGLSYAEGFEDAIELSLHELDKIGSVSNLREKLELILVVVKERKFDRIKLLLESR
jgi:hypothetical protein